MKKKGLSFIVAILIILAAWHVGSIVLDKPFLPTPVEAISSFIELLINGEMTKDFWVSTYRVSVSILLAVVLAVPLGLVLGRNEFIDRIIAPIIYILYPLPKAVFLPIIVVIMGLGNGPKIFLITLIIFFQIVVVTRDAAKSIPLSSIQSIRSLGAKWYHIYYHLIWPYCLPKILTSLRITLGTAIAVLFFAETFASLDGLGYFILDGMERRDYPEMYAGILAMAFLGMILYAVIDGIEHIYCKWQKL